MVLDTVDDGGGPEPNSAVTVEVMPYPLGPDNPDNEHLYSVQPELRAATVTVTASEGSSRGGEAAALTAAFEGLPAAHDGETAFTFRIAFSEDVATSVSEMRDQALTVTGGTVTGAARVDGRADLWSITVTPSGTGAIAILLPAGRDCAEAGAVCTADGRQLSVRFAVAVASTAPGSSRPPLTAQFESVPRTYDGTTAFTVELRFSEEVTTGESDLRDHVVEVTGGAVRSVRPLTPGSSARWEVAVEPASDGEVVIGVSLGAACGEPAAVCTKDGRSLFVVAAVIVSGPAAQPDPEDGTPERDPEDGTPEPEPEPEPVPALPLLGQLLLALGLLRLGLLRRVRLSRRGTPGI